MSYRRSVLQQKKKKEKKKNTKIMSSTCKEINVFYFFNLTTALVIYSVCMQT